MHALPRAPITLSRCVGARVKVHSAVWTGLVALLCWAPRVGSVTPAHGRYSGKTEVCLLTCVRTCWAAPRHSKLSCYPTLRDGLWWRARSCMRAANWWAAATSSRRWLRRACCARSWTRWPRAHEPGWVGSASQCGSAGACAWCAWCCSNLVCSSKSCGVLLILQKSASRTVSSVSCQVHAVSVCDAGNNKAACVRGQPACAAQPVCLPAARPARLAGWSMMSVCRHCPSAAPCSRTGLLMANKYASWTSHVPKLGMQ